MKALWTRFTTFDDPAAWQRWLAAWRWWWAVGVLAAALAAGVYPLLPWPYRTRAQVVVDHNLEAALPQGTDRQLFYYLSRENKKLEALAWSDEVLTPVAERLGQPLARLRGSGPLVLRQEKDGVWHFWVTAATPQAARQAAALWAQGFVEHARAAVAAAQEAEAWRAQQAQVAEALAQTRFLCQHLRQVQTELEAATPPDAVSPWQAWALAERLAWLASGAQPLPPWPTTAADAADLLAAARSLAQARAQACPQRLTMLEAELQRTLAARQAAEARSRGVSPFVIVTPTQTRPEGLPLQRVPSRAGLMLAAALLAWAGSALAVIFWPAAPGGDA